jgi:hypothetical protein
MLLDEFKSIMFAKEQQEVGQAAGRDKMFLDDDISDYNNIIDSDEWVDEEDLELGSPTMEWLKFNSNSNKIWSPTNR